MNKNKIELKTLPRLHFSEAAGKKIKRIGVDEFGNTCRVVLEDDSLLFVQSQADKNLLLGHGLSCHVIPVDDDGSALSMGSSSHLDWFSSANA